MRPYAYIPHHIPGRMRIKIAGATPGILNEFRSRALAMPDVQSVETNPTTGSVLVLYSRGAGRDFRQILSTRVTDLVAFAPDSPSEIGDYSTTATNLLKTIKHTDDELRARSGGRIDLKLLFPLAMVGLAAVTLPASLQTPLWLSFLMFGFSSFESMHTGALEQPGGKSGEEHESNAASGAAQG
jgi:hypothetical protein